MRPVDGRIRLSELLASLSLATDLGTGRPMGLSLVSGLIAARIAEQMGLPTRDVRCVYQVTLLRYLGCTSDSAETAAIAGGDDLGFNRTMAPVFFGGPGEGMRALLAATGRGDPPLRKARVLVEVLTDRSEPAASLAGHCEVAARLADRLGLDPEVRESLEHVYERWDGKGYPRRVSGEELTLASRISTAAADAALFWEMGLDPIGILRRRSGKAYDPAVVEVAAAVDLTGGEWEEVMAAEPEPVVWIEEVDPALEVIADFVDLKSPWTRGHSRAVADLAGAAGEEAGFEPEDQRLLRRAGLVHDLGRVGVENGIWDKAGALSVAEFEKVRLHPYLTERILVRSAALAGVAEVACSHHERADGSGYHRRLGASALPPAARLLAAADAMVALRSDRPHRPAFEPEEAAAAMGVEVSEGRLDPEAVVHVIRASGGEVPPRVARVDGLTEREVEVLRLIARGSTNRQVADHLFISAKTVGRHVENIYAKIGVNTRAGAAVYAMEKRLLG